MPDNVIHSIGFVFTSPELAFTYSGESTAPGYKGTKVLFPNNGKTEHFIYPRYSLNQSATIRKNAIIPSDVNLKEDIGNYDQCRGETEFVIEYVGTDNDNNPNIAFRGFHIIARRLFPSGLYNIEGELVDFFYRYEGHRHNITDIRIVRKMHRIFI